jgi:hypothetical protein
VRPPDPADPALVARLVGWGRRLAGRAACGPVAVLANRSGELVVRAGGVVVKAHHPRVRHDDVRRRLVLAERLAGVMLGPIAGASLGGRTVTLWPAGRALREADLPEVDWPQVGALLAALHRAPAPAGLPGGAAPARIRHARERLLGCPHAGGRRALAVTGALATVPPSLLDGPATGRPRVLVHGDFHLGQLVRHDGRWRLIDIDDLGVDDPAWDLARAAAWFAAGVIEATEWAGFLAGYRDGGGPAIPPSGDPWPVLDPYARALTAQIAALAVAGGHLDIAETYVACCRRISAMYPAGASGE